MTFFDVVVGFTKLIGGNFVQKERLCQEDFGLRPGKIFLFVLRRGGGF